MAEIFNFGEYQFVLNKRNQSSLTINAHTESGKSIFESGPFDLKKIKYDTVQAALSKTNEKNLIVKLHYEEGQQPYNGQLLVSVIVKYDFLPEFSQEIILKERKLNENDSIKVKLTNLESQIDSLNKKMKMIESEGVVKVEDHKSVSLGNQNGVAELKLFKGKYLIQISGLHKGTYQGEKIGFGLKIGEKNTEKKDIKLAEMTPYFVSAPYTYPFSLSEVVELTEDSQVEVYSRSNGSSSAMNFMVTVKPVLA